MKKSSNVLIEVNSISKSFKGKNVFDSISFSIYQKEIFSIIGFSGEGKSTLLNILCGIESYDKGSISFFGENEDNYVSVRKFLLGYSSQNYSYYDELTIDENIEYFGNLYELEGDFLKKRKENLLDLFNLKELINSPPKSLSEGQKKRLDLICSLIHDPKVLILDEPTANLDFKLRDELLEYIKKIKLLGISIIYVSHNLEEVEELKGRVCMINKGSIKILEHSKNLKKDFMRFAKHG